MSDVPAWMTNPTTRPKPIGELMEELLALRATHARLKWFDPRDLLQSPAIQTVTKGLLEDGDFLLDE